MYAPGESPVKRALPQARGRAGAATLRAVARAVLLWAGFAVGLAAAPEAFASPVERASLGDEVFAGPTHPHATSIYTSPAALGLGLSGHELYAGGMAFADRLSIDRFDDRGGDAGEAQGIAQARGHALSGGGTLAYAYTGPRISGGLALHTPQATSFLSGEDPLSYHSFGGFHYQAMISGAGAIRITDDILFGAGLSLAYSWFSLDYDRDTALAGGRDTERGVDGECDGERCGLENPAAAQRHELSLRTGGVGDVFDTRNVALTVSALYQLAEGWWLGASFVQPPGGFGPVTLAGDARVEPAPRDDDAETASGAAELRYHLPQTTRLGLRGPILPDYELVVGLQWHHASSHDRLDFRYVGESFERAGAPAWQPRYRGLRDAIRVSAGVEGDVGRATRVGGRARLDSGTTGDRALSPIQVDGPNASLATGIEFRLNDQILIMANYELGWHPARTSDPSAFDPSAKLDCVDGGYDLGACSAARDGRALPSAAGRYRRLRHAAQLALRYESL